ncbi:MAG: hypothetical protein IKO72_05965 [Kiritimatiellae bacterium]|nr:hypothetical protein [Kiritimatiellia bacterium]
MKKVLIGLMVFMEAFISRRGHCLTWCEENEAGDFRVESLRFDFCGVSRNESEKYRDTEEHLRISAPQKPVLAKEWLNILRHFQNKVYAFEESFSTSRTDRVKVILKCICNDLMEQKNLCISARMRFPFRCYLGDIEKLEYSLARITEYGNMDVLNEREVLEFLPDDLFVIDNKACNWTVFDTRSFERCRDFRDMIVLGICLRRYRFIKGHYPQTLDCLTLPQKMKRRFLMDLSYDVKGDVWCVFKPGVRNGRNPAPFNVFIPAIQNPADFVEQTGRAMWYSSDFSRKRARLFQTGRLNTGINKWECRILFGKIVK